MSASADLARLRPGEPASRAVMREPNGQSFDLSLAKMPSTVENAVTPLHPSANDGLLPLRPQPTDGNPEELVQQIESWPRTTPFQHGQLLSQHQVFKDEIPAVAEESKERPEREPEHAEHNQSYNRILAAGRRLGYAIDFKDGQSFGEPQR